MSEKYITVDTPVSEVCIGNFIWYGDDEYNKGPFCITDIDLHADRIVFTFERPIRVRLGSIHEGFKVWEFTGIQKGLTSTVPVVTNYKH